MKQPRSGVSIIEVLIVVSIIGVLSAIGFALLPRQDLAVDRASGVLASAIQFARFEAIKRNEVISARLGNGATDVLVVRQSDGAVIRTFTLDQQSNAVAMKGLASTLDISFNARGVATSLVARNVMLGIVGSTQWDRNFSISAQGLVGDS